MNVFDRIQSLPAVSVTIRAGKCFMEDKVMTLSASLSFYTLLSFAPLMVLAVWATSTLGHGTQDSLLEQVGLLAGPSAREVAESVIDSAEQEPSLGSIVGITGVAVSLLAATTVFAQLQSALNAIWGIKVQRGNAITSWLRRRFLSIGVIAAVGFVLIVSLVASAVIGMFLAGSGRMWEALNQLMSAAILGGLFTLLFRYLPDARLPWTHAVKGGVVTALLFSIGKSLIGIYLARGHIGGAYGAASSLVLLLVWVYYSGAIFFFGAEFIQAWVRESGGKIPAATHAKKTR